MENPGSIRRFAVRLVCAIAAAFAFLPAVSAQAPTAELSGTVSDSTGAVVSGAQITATNGDTGIKSPAGQTMCSMAENGERAVKPEGLLR